LANCTRSQKELDRDFVVSEYDYSQQKMAKSLGVQPKDARLFMIADKEWKFMHAEGGFRPMLFDLRIDPHELNDLGADSTYQNIIDIMYQRLGRWSLRMSQRTTIDDDTIEKKQSSNSDVGIILGVYDDNEISDRSSSFYKGLSKGRYS